MNFKHAAIWGIYLGLWVSLGTQILTWAGLGLTNWFVALTYLSVILFVWLGLKNLIKISEINLTYVHAALWVLIVVLVSRVMFQSYMYLYTHFIEPDWVDTVAEMWKVQLQEANQSEETISKMISGFRRSYETVPMFTTEIIKYGLSQFILGLIVSLFFVFRFRRSKIII